MTERTETERNPRILALDIAKDMMGKDQRHGEVIALAYRIAAFIELGNVSLLDCEDTTKEIVSTIGQSYSKSTDR